MEGSGACKPPHAAQASSQPSPCVFSCPPVPIRKEVEGNNLVWPPFLLPQGWQWDSKVPLWLDKATTTPAYCPLPRQRGLASQPTSEYQKVRGSGEQKL